jgi:hypothetical protein
MNIYDLLQLSLLLFCIASALAYLAWNRYAVAAWWYQRIHKELRDAAPWADPRKVRRVYREELKKEAIT